MREGADPVDADGIVNGEGIRRTGRSSDVAQHALAPRTIAQFTCPSNAQLTSMLTSRPQTSMPRLSSRAGRRSVTPASSSRTGDLALMDASSYSANWVLLFHTQHFHVRVCAGWWVSTAAPSVHGHHGDVGGGIALGVVVLQPADPGFQRVDGELVLRNAGIDLANRAFGVVRVLVLGDAGDLAKSTRTMRP